MCYLYHTRHLFTHDLKIPSNIANNLPAVLFDILRESKADFIVI